MRNTTMAVAMHKVTVVIETKSLRITGDVAVPAVSRLSDYANDPQRRFWAVTDADIAPLAAPARRREAPFILVASHEICVISPLEEQAQRSPAGAGAHPVDDPLARAAAAFDA